MHIDTAPYPAPAGTITSTSDSSSQDPNAFLYELICNKTASHIEIFAKIVHEIIFSLPIRDINIHQYHNISQH
ncbi:hypothetical protein BHF26_17035 [Escherichia coli]|nr:hypothetical protein WR16_12570 [Escherichia coli]KLH95462.1 hypothetical protein WR18_01350 [Escherichia coli]KPO48693.1 hypothetical protein ACU82_16525 [Escherichia coli]KPO62743.1 hypothetical protein ACU64_19725 [Escherichia coli]KZI29772.1 hypothetical protein AWG75_24315 [Escherichia coli]